MGVDEWSIRWDNPRVNFAMAVISVFIALTCVLMEIVAFFIYEEIYQYIKFLEKNTLYITIGAASSYALFIISLKFVVKKFNLEEDFLRDFHKTAIIEQIRYFSWFLLSYVLYLIPVYILGEGILHDMPIGYIGFIILWFGFQARPLIFGVLEIRFPRPESEVRK